MRRLPCDRYANNPTQAMRSAKAQAEFVLANVSHLRTIDRKGKLERVVKRFSKLLSAGEDLTPRQLSYLDQIYEQTGCRVASHGNPS